MSIDTSAIPAGMWTCTSCDALNPNRARACGECGEGRDEETTRRRLEAGRELSGVRKDLSAARGLFVLGAVAESLGLLLYLWLGLAPGWVLGVSASVIALHVAGALLVYRQPVLWAYVVAGYRTLYIVPTTILDPPTMTVPIIMTALSLAITVGLWFLPRRARRAQALIKGRRGLQTTMSTFLLSGW